jgi:hypothetical protein
LHHKAFHIFEISTPYSLFLNLDVLFQKRKNPGKAKQCFFKVLNEETSCWENDSLYIKKLLVPIKDAVYIAARGAAHGF